MTKKSDNLSLLVERLQLVTQPHERVSRCIDRLKSAHKQYPSLGIQDMLGQSSKLGLRRYAAAFNLPLRLTCCDGRGIASSVCVSVCYYHKMLEGKTYKDANNGRTDLEERAERNFVISQRDDFRELLIAAIHKRRVQLVRIHSFGDFYSSQYVSDWIRSIRSCRRITFLAYTRSWQLPEMIPSLTALAAERNMNLLLSFDPETGVPPEIPNTRRAWLATDDRKLPPVKSLIVFRSTKEKDQTTRRLTVVTSMNNCTVCPHQNGRAFSGKNATCLTCRICMFHERE